MFFNLFENNDRLRLYQSMAQNAIGYNSSYSNSEIYQRLELNERKF
jgi:hypothetical protein